MMSEGQDVLSSDPDDEQDKGRGIPMSRGRPDLHRKIARMKEMVVSDDDDPLSPFGSPLDMPTFGGREKFVELKRKLEEDQANRFRMASMAENKDDPSLLGVINVESLLDSIRSDLENRDQSRSNVSSARVLETHPKFLEMYQQIKERDHTILNLESRINEMDRQVIDLQDSVNQRDKLIGSKNEAVSVVHSKYQKELDLKENELRKTQETMIRLEKNLSSIQDQSKTEKSRFNEEIKAHRDRLENLTDTNKALETKCSVVQEELVRLREENEENKAAVLERDEEVRQKDVRLTELTESLEKSSTQMTRLRIQFQNKLKALREKQKELEKEAKDAGKIRELENRIAELEEEKGQLLLEQIDIEDQQAVQEETNVRVYKLENQAAISEEIITTLTHSISSLEYERGKLSADLEEMQEKYTELLQTPTSNHDHNEDSLLEENSKLESALRNVEELWKAEKDHLNQEIQGCHAIMESVLEQKSGADHEFTRLRHLIDEYQAQLTEKDSQLSEKEAKLIENTQALEMAEKNVKRLKIQFQTRLKAMRQKEQTGKGEDADGIKSANQVELLQAEIGRLQESANQVDILQAEIGRLQESAKQVETLQGRLQESENQVQILQAEIGRLHESANQAEFGRQQESENQVEILQAEIGRLQESENQVKILQAEIGLLHESANQADILRAEFGRQQESENHVEILQAEMRRLQESENHVEILQAEIRRLQESENQVEILQSEIQRLQQSTNQIQELEAEIARLVQTTAQLDQLQAENYRLQQSANYVYQLQAEISTLQQSAYHVEQLTAEVSNLQAVLSTKEEMYNVETERLNTEIHGYHAKMEALINEKTRIETELAGLHHGNTEFLALIAEKDNQLEEIVLKLAQLEVEKASVTTAYPTTSSIFGQPSPKSAAVDAFLNWEKSQPENKPDSSGWWGGSDDQSQVVEESMTKKRTFLTNEDEEAQAKVYQLEVQLAEVQISLDEATSHVYDLNSTLEIVSYENSRLQDENSNLRRETEALKQSQTPSPEHTHESSPVSQGQVTRKQNELTGKGEDADRIKSATQIEVLQAEVVRLQESANQVEILQADIGRLQKSAKQVAILQGRLEESTNQVGNLQAEIIRLQESANQVEILQAEIGRLQESAKQVAILQGRLEESANQVEISQGRLQESANQAEILQAEIERLQESTKQVAILQGRLEESANQVEISQERLEESANQVEISQERLQESANQVENLQAEIRRLQESKNQVEILQAEIGRLQESANQVEILQAEIGRLQESAKQVAILQVRLQESANHIDVLQAEIGRLQESENQVDILQVEIGRLQESAYQVEILKAEIERLQESAKQIAILQGRLQESENQADILRAEIGRLQESANQVEILHAEIGRLQESENQVAILQAEIGRLQESANRVEILQAEIRRLHESTNQIQELETEIARLHQTTVQLDQLQDENYRLQQSANYVYQLQAEISTLQQSAYHVEQLTAEVSNLQVVLSTKEEVYNVEKKGLIAEIQGYHAKMETLVNEKTRLDAELAVLHHDNSEFLALIAEKDNQLEEIGRKLAQVEVEKASVTTTNPTTSSIFGQPSPKSAAVDAFLNWEKSQPEKKSDTSGWWGGSDDQPQVVEDSMTKKRAFLTNEDEEAEAKVYQLEVQLAEVQISLDEASSQVSDLNSTLEIVSYENSRLQDENSHLRRETEALKEKATLSLTPSPEHTHESSPVLQGQVLNEELELVESARKKLTTEVHELKLRNAKMIKQFKQLKEKYEGLVKANSNKTEFSLESAMADELQSQVKQKDEALEENFKIIKELRGEKESLSQKVDIIERANEQLISMKESQERYIIKLTGEVKQLQQEISGLKWRLEEVENMAGAGQTGDEGGFNSGYSEDSNRLQQQNQIAAQEIQHLQHQNSSLLATVEQLNAQNQQLSILAQGQVQAISQPLQGQQPQVVTEVPLQLGLIDEDAVDARTLIPIPPPPNSGTLSNIEALQQALEQEASEKAILERKIELLQGKILEIEQSEMKCFEESLMLKSWTRQLEMDNQKFQMELEQLYGSAKDGDMNNVKVKTLQNEVIRLVDVLQDRDKRCEQLTSEITRLLEERDRLQLKLSNVLKHNINLHEEYRKGTEFPDTEVPSFDREGLEKKLAELEDVNYAINIDLRREREARRLVQEQLFFSQSTRGYRGELRRPMSAPSTPPPSNYSSPKISTPRTPIVSPAQFVPLQPVLTSTPLQPSASDAVSVRVAELTPESLPSSPAVMQL